MIRLKKFAKFFYEPAVNVLRDYKDVFLDAGKKAIKKPLKTSLYTTLALGAGVVSYCAPNETDFRTTCLNHHHRILLISERIRNKNSENFIDKARKLDREDRLGFLPLGLVTLVYESHLDPNTREFGKVFLKPRLAEYLDRIIDVGFLGEWYYMSRAMVDYDVNEDEFL